MHERDRRVPRSVALSLVAGAFAAGTRVPALAQSAGTPVRMGAMALDACAEAYYGADAGIWSSNGIAPQITTSQNTQAIVEAVLAGDLDIGISSPLNLAAAISRGIAVAMIAPAVVYSAKVGNPNLVVAKDGPVKVPKDLIGATFGVSTLADLNQLSLFVWMEKNGVPRDRAKFLELRFSELGSALQRNLIQAAIITEPFKSDAMRAGQIRELGDTFLAIAPEMCPIVWFSTKAWLDANRDLARRVVKTVYAIAAFSNTHPQDTGVTLARITKMDPSVIATMRRLPFATSNERRYTEPILIAAENFGMLQRPVSFAEYSPPL